MQDTVKVNDKFFRDAIVSLDSDFKGGIWQNGLWHSGSLYGEICTNDGYDYNMWDDITWLKCNRINSWEYFVWGNGTWLTGKWYYGSWWDGTWNGGTWEEGQFVEGNWLNGLWKGGDIFIKREFRRSWCSPKTCFKPYKTISLNYARYS